MHITLTQIAYAGCTLSLNWQFILTVRHSTQETPWGNISYKTRRSSLWADINLKSIAAARQKKGVMSFTTATLKQSKPLHWEPDHSCKETTYVGQSKQTQRGKDEGGTVKYEWGSEPKGGEGGCREIFWKYDMKEKTERTWHCIITVMTPAEQPTQTQLTILPPILLLLQVFLNAWIFR